MDLITPDMLWAARPCFVCATAGRCPHREESAAVAEIEGMLFAIATSINSVAIARERVLVIQERRLLNEPNPERRKPSAKETHARTGDRSADPERAFRHSAG